MPKRRRRKKRYRGCESNGRWTRKSRKGEAIALPRSSLRPPNIQGPQNSKKASGEGVRTFRILGEMAVGDRLSENYFTHGGTSSGGGGVEPGLLEGDRDRHGVLKKTKSFLTGSSRGFWPESGGAQRKGNRLLTCMRRPDVRHLPRSSRDRHRKKSSGGKKD